VRSSAATRGEVSTQAVVWQQQHSGGRGVFCTGGRGSRGAAGARGRRRKGGSSRDLFEIFKNLRDPSIK
jgi:hypothetical protein